MVLRIPTKLALRSCTVVTGAASGIGKSFAIQLAKRGTDLVLVDRSGGDLDSLASTLRRQHGIEAHPLVLNLIDGQARVELLKYLHAKRLRVHGLINCAGVGAHGAFVAHMRDSIDQIIDVNSRAVVHLNRLFLRGMIRRGEGMIINLSSTAAFEKMPDWAVYGATKAFVQSFTESLQAELSGTGVYVALVCPGPTTTPFFASAGFDEEAIPTRAQSPEAVVAEAIAGIDQRRKLIVTGKHNRMRIFLHRVSLRSTIQSILRLFRKLKPSV